MYAGKPHGSLARPVALARLAHDQTRKHHEAELAPDLVAASSSEGSLTTDTSVATELPQSKRERRAPGSNRKPFGSDQFVRLPSEPSEITLLRFLLGSEGQPGPSLFPRTYEAKHVPSASPRAAVWTVRSAGRLSECRTSGGWSGIADC